MSVLKYIDPDGSYAKARNLLTVKSTISLHTMFTSPIGLSCYIFPCSDVRNPLFVPFFSVCGVCWKSLIVANLIFRSKAFIFNYAFNTFWHILHQYLDGITVKSSPFMLYSLTKFIIIFWWVFIDYQLSFNNSPKIFYRIQAWALCSPKSLIL